MVDITRHTTDDNMNFINGVMRAHPLVMFKTLSTETMEEYQSNEPFVIRAAVATDFANDVVFDPSNIGIVDWWVILDRRQKIGSKLAPMRLFFASEADATLYIMACPLPACRVYPDDEAPRIRILDNNKSPYALTDDWHTHRLT